MDNEKIILLLDNCMFSRMGLTCLIDEIVECRYCFKNVSTITDAREVVNSLKIFAIILTSLNDVTHDRIRIFLHEVRLRFPETKLIVYSDIFSLSLMKLFHSCIIDGYFSCLDVLSESAGNLRKVLIERKRHLSINFIQQMEHAALADNSLTPAESRTLRLILEGKSPAQISRLIKRSVKTVSSQKRSVMRKLGVTRTSELVMMSKSLYRSIP